jgi:hypothetical protein
MSSEGAVKARRARKARACIDCNYHGHGQAIQPGDVYLVITDFRGSDAGYASYAGHPVQASICATCAYPRHRPLVTEREARW